MTKRRTVRGTIALLLLCSILLPGAARAYSPEVEAISRDLKADSPIRRYEAVESLGELRTPEAIRLLIELTADEDNSWLAVRRLVILKGLAEPFLLDALKGEDPVIVKYSIYALGDIRSRAAVEPIMEYLYHPDEEIRRNAVFALGNIRDPRAVEPLIRKLRDPDNVVREYAAAALDHLGDKQAVPYLREALKNEQGSIFNMATSLFNLGDEEVIELLIDKLKDPHSQNRLYAVYVLGKIRDPREIEPLIEVLADDNVQWLAAKALINLGELAVPALIRTLKRKDRDIRLYSIYALGEIGDREATLPVMEQIIDPDQTIREYTADALIALDDREVLPHLLDYLEKGDFTIQSMVLRVLGHLGDESIAREVYPLLENEHPEVRTNGAYALGELKNPQATPYLVNLLGDEDSLVSRSAANALIKIGPATVPTLLAELPRRKGSTETWIIYILGKLKASEAMDALVGKLGSPDTFVRRYATAALTEIGDPGAEEHLVTMLSDNDPHVRMYASFGLMEFGGRLSIKLLLNALKSEETRWLAIRILDRIGPRGVDELIAALKDPETQWYAADTLIKLDGIITLKPEVFAESGIRAFPPDELPQVLKVLAANER